MTAIVVITVVPVGSASAATPPPTPHPYKVQTPYGFAITRNGPGTEFTKVGELNNNQPIDVTCQSTGSAFKGDQIWDHLAHNTWITDRYVSTPAVNQFTPNIPRCETPPGLCRGPHDPENANCDGAPSTPVAPSPPSEPPRWSGPLPGYSPDAPSGPGDWGPYCIPSWAPIRHGDDPVVPWWQPFCGAPCDAVIGAGPLR